MSDQAQQEKSSFEALAEIRAQIATLQMAVDRLTGEDRRQATKDSFDRGPTEEQKNLEDDIDRMVAQALAQGRRTSVVLRSLFNLTPGLSGR